MEALLYENGIQVLPIYPGALHGYRIHMALLEPGGNGKNIL
jgi:hypothetical protein